jgi:UDP:flavonoid glycosyltransferase YjiC (YdhE family)
MSDQESDLPDFMDGVLELRMGVGMPEDSVPEDARRISVRAFISKAVMTSTSRQVRREIIALEIRKRAEELIRTIHEQMDRQEKANG